MSLVFAAITPHPPLLIPTIGKDELKKIEKTKIAMEKLEEELYLSKPEVIVIISPHGHLHSDAFTVNFCTEFETDLREFGDLSVKLKYKGSSHLSHAIQHEGRGKHMPVTTLSEPKLDHGATVPLYYLTPHLRDIPVVPVGFSDLDWKTHFEFGELIKEQIMKTNKRVAVIASGDLSHALTTDAPAGFSATGSEFDAKIQELLATRNTTGMLQLDPEFVGSAAECGFRSFLILMGILRDIHYTYESYAYEGPFGVGYLTANFVL